MTTYFGKELFIRFTGSAFRKLLSVYVFSYFPFGFEGRMWDLIVSVPDHCLSFYFESQFYRNKEIFSLLNFHFGLPGVPFVNCYQFMYLVISLLVLRAGCGI